MSYDANSQAADAYDAANVQYQRIVDYVTDLDDLDLIQAIKQVYTLEGRYTRKELQEWLIGHLADL